MEINEKNVGIISSLLGTEEEKVKSALESENGLEKVVKDFKEKNQVFNLDEFAKLKKNIRQETINTLTEDDIPKEFKNKAVGWKMESIEKEIKDKYGFEGDFSNVQDLVSKIVEQAKSNKGDESVLEENRKLKERIVQLDEESKDAIKKAKENFDGELIKHDFDRALNKLEFDYEEGDQLENQRKLFKMSFMSNYKLKREDGKTVVYDENGEKLTDKKMDSLMLDGVAKDFAKAYGFQLKDPDTAGQGGGSSKSKDTGIVGVTFNDYIKEKGIQPNTNEADNAYKEWREANPQ
jgi:hypothetical protein